MKTQEETRKIIVDIAKEIEREGGSSYFVGGYVRDKVLGRKNEDYDIEIYGLTEDKIKTILSHYGKNKIVGEKFGVYNVSGLNVDFSVPRKDNKVGLKHTDFEVICDPFMSFEESTARRDFTINALLQNVLTEEIIDVNNGLDDIKNRKIRIVNKEHFSEDPLRVLRAARFSAQLDFEINKDTKELCKTINLKDLSSERIQEETTKALLSKNPRRYFDALKEMNQLDYWYKELYNLINLEQNKKYHLEDVYEHTMRVINETSKEDSETCYKKGLMYSALCHDFGKAIVTDKETGRAIGHEVESEKLSEVFLERIKMDKQTIKYVKELCLKHMEPKILWYDNSSNKKIIKTLDNCAFIEDLMILSDCDSKGAIRGDGYKEKNSLSYKEWEEKSLNLFYDWLKNPHLTGKNLIDIGLLQSKELGDILDKARTLEYSNDFVPAMRQLFGIYNIPKEKLNLLFKNKNAENPDYNLPVNEDKKYKTIIVHDGAFHADDVMCVSLAKLYNPDIKVLRTRNEKILANASKSDSVLICDVGLGELDHHQSDSKKRADGKLMAGCGLLYEKFVKENLIQENELLLNIIKTIEHYDNGQIEKDEQKDIVTKLCDLMQPTWNEDSNLIESHFKESCDLTRVCLDALLSKTDSKDLLKINKKIIEREGVFREANEKAKEYINEKIYDDTSNFGYLVLDKNVPIELLCDTKINFVISPATNSKQMNIQCVPPEPGSFEQKIPIPNEYKTQLDFLHKANFFGCIKYNDEKEKLDATKKLKKIAREIDENYKVKGLFK